jgi:hypothetical protein
VKVPLGLGLLLCVFFSALSHGCISIFLAVDDHQPTLLLLLRCTQFPPLPPRKPLKKKHIYMYSSPLAISVKLMLDQVVGGIIWQAALINISESYREAALGLVRRVGGKEEGDGTARMPNKKAPPRQVIKKRA